MNRLRSLLIVLALLGVVIYLALGVFSSPEALGQSFSGFEWKLIPLILLFSLFNYIARFFRWNFYCRKLQLGVERRHNIGIFGAGLVATLTPMKSGELVKSYLLKEDYGTPVSSSAPMVVAERVTDEIAMLTISGVALVIISLARLSQVSNPLYLAGAFAFLALLILALVLTAILVNRNINFRIPLLSKVFDWIRNFLTTARSLLKLRILAVALGLSIPAWFAECWGFYFVLRGFDVGLPLVICVFIYAFASIVGTLTFLPGGLGGVEAIMIGLLILYGIGHSDAVASTLVIRAFTLWFAVLVGFSAFTVYNFFYLSPRRVKVESSLPVREGSK